MNLILAGCFSNSHCNKSPAASIYSLYSTVRTAIAQALMRDLTAKVKMLHRWSKHNCTAPWEDDEGDYYRKWMYSIDGGSGAILSRGLMKAINHAEIEDCIRNQ